MFMANLLSSSIPALWLQVSHTIAQAIKSSLPFALFSDKNLNSLVDFTKGDLNSFTKSKVEG